MVIKDDIPKPQIPHIINTIKKGDTIAVAGSKFSHERRSTFVAALRQHGLATKVRPLHGMERAKAIGLRPETTIPPGPRLKPFSEDDLMLATLVSYTIPPKMLAQLLRPLAHSITTGILPGHFNAIQLIHAGDMGACH